MGFLVMFIIAICVLLLIIIHQIFFRERDWPKSVT